jgi:hypothetical protein
MDGEMMEAVENVKGLVKQSNVRFKRTDHGFG